MGLDIYAGPMTRYYARDWLSVVQRYGAEQGMEVMIVRPGEPIQRTGSKPGMLDRIFRKLGLKKDPPPGQPAPNQPSNAQIQQLVTAWRDAIVGSLAEHAQGIKPWNESIEADYDTDKPDWDGLACLILWAAYAECPDLTPPTEPTREWQHDPAFKRMAEQNGGENYQALLRNCEVWLPLDIPGTFDGPLPNEHTVTFGSVPMLLRDLERLNHATWQMDLDELASTPTGELPASANAFEYTAKFGFAILYRLTRFANDNRVPMILDY